MTYPIALIAIVAGIASAVIYLNVTLHAFVLHFAASWQLRAVLALAAAVVALCIIGRMDKTTSHAMRFSVVLLAASLFGQALAVAFSQWEPHFDVMLYGALLANMLASRRHESHVWTHPRTQLASLVVSGATFVYFIVSISFI